MIAKLRAQPQPAGETRGKAGVDGDNYGQNIGVNYGIAIIGHQLKEDEKRRLGWYLHNLASTLKRLRLQGIASRLAREGDGVSMPNVYVMLATTRIVLREVYEETSLQALDVETFIQQHDPDTVLPDYARTAIAVDAKQDIDTAWSSESTAMYGGLFDIHDDDLPQQMQASDRIECHGHQLTIEAMQQHPRLVLRGEPGSGKSTALFYIAWLLAWRGLGSELSDDQQQTLTGWPDHLLPVVVPLRKLADSLDRSHPVMACWQTPRRASRSCRRHSARRCMQVILTGLTICWIVPCTVEMCWSASMAWTKCPSPARPVLVPVAGPRSRPCVPSQPTILSVPW
jgi:hypothetical protein